MKRKSLPDSVKKALADFESRRIDRSVVAQLPLTIILNGRIPSKKNSRINTKSGKSFPSKAYTEWNKSALAQLPQVKTKKGLVLSVEIFIRFPDLAKADLTNKTESLMDLLVDAAIIEDDQWKIARPLILDGDLDRNNPGATIIIKERTKCN